MNLYILFGQQPDTELLHAFDVSTVAAKGIKRADP